MHTKKGLHISMGADAKMYILNDGKDYIKNLSTDLEYAKIKAKEYLLKYDPDLTNEELKVPVDIWCREKSYSVGDPNYVPYTPDWLKFNDHIETHKIYLLSLKNQELKDAGNKQSHIGTIDEKVENLELTITDIFNYEIHNPNGFPIISFGHKFVDQNGNYLIYFGNSKQFVKEEMIKKTWSDELIKENVSIYKVGDKITVNGTIKDHTYEKKNMYMPLTVIKRPKTNRKDVR